MQLDMVLSDARRRLQAIRQSGHLSQFARQHNLGEPWCRKFAAGNISNPGVLSLHKLCTALDAWETAVALTGTPHHGFSTIS